MIGRMKSSTSAEKGIETDHATAEYQLGDTLVGYQQDPRTGAIGLCLCPLAKSGERVSPRRDLGDSPDIRFNPISNTFPSPRGVEPLIQLKVIGDDYPGGFATGRTLRNSSTVSTLRFAGRELKKAGGVQTLITHLTDDVRLYCQHFLVWSEGCPAVKVFSRITNLGEKPLDLELLSSFSLGNITPFDPADAAGRIILHRFRSNWSAEGRLESVPIEQLGLERSWAGASVAVDRFGQVGSMPVRGYFPFVALEDTRAGVIWAAQLAWGGSWQIEVSRQDDSVNMTGGLADRDFGHWIKTLKPGERFESPSAFLTGCEGSWEEACHRLVRSQEIHASGECETEREGGIVFNELCRSWGHPSHDDIEALAQRLRESAVKYLVIDAGWYRKDSEPGLSCYHGDWIPSAKHFSRGLKLTADRIRECGLVPGLWFEMETCGQNSPAFGKTERLVHLDDLPLTVNSRRFLDLRKKEVADWIAETVIGTLRDNNFGYLKVDYNDSLGIGIDGVESPGEGLRALTEASYSIFDRIRAELPDLVIENCASGGHRLEPGYVGRTSMSSFSDAHECFEIPIIAANLQFLIPPRKSQIWAVLHKEDSFSRLTFSLAATFLGRMCLSGDVVELAPWQWSLTEEGTAFYQAAWPVIRHGRSRRCGPVVISYRNPSGWQAVVRQQEEAERTLVVVHTFGNVPTKPVSIPLGELANGKSWKITQTFPEEQRGMGKLGSDQLELSPIGEFSAWACLLQSI